MRRLLFYAAVSAISLFLLTMNVRAYTTPTLPGINTNNILNVTSAPYNAVGDGVATNTSAIQKAINAASAGPATNGLSGGTVELPPGIFMCGPITLGNNVNLQLDAGAILRLLPLGQYPGGTVNPSNFISAKNLHDLEISGTGAIDGQGAPWWPYANTNGALRPRMIAPSGCSRFLIQNVTLSNSPMFHIAISGSMADVTVRGVTIRAPSSSDPLTPGHNTDACDVSGTNILVENCDISVGDDNFTCGGGTSDVLLTNNTYGAGHGVSIGSYTSGGVSNITVVNCTFNNTDQGIRIKSDRDRGGVVQNISYYNLAMTNVAHPILIYAAYNATGVYRSLDSLTPAIAAGYPPAAITATTPSYRNITVSNVTATAQSGRSAGLIWGLPELWATNITLIKVQITADKTFEVYEARNVKFVDSKIIVPAGVPGISYYDADLTLTNSAPGASFLTLNGLANSNGGPTLLALYDAPAAMTSTDAFGGSPITLNGSVLTNTGNLTLSNSTVVNFALGANAAKMVVTGNLALRSTLNITNAGGFTATNYPLFTYTGGLSGNPILGATPSIHGYAYSLNTNTAGQVKLVVTPPAPPRFGNSHFINSGTRLVLTGSGGVTNGAYYVLVSTNLMFPLNQWAVLVTNTFDGGGNFNFTNTVPTNSPQQFFALQIP